MLGFRRFEKGPFVSSGFVIEQEPVGRTLVVTGPWTSAAARALSLGDADGLTLNSAKGFCEPDLEFLEDWPIRRLRVIARWVPSAAPVLRLAGTLEGLSLELAPRARLDASSFSALQQLFVRWSAIQRGTLAQATSLRDVGLMWFQGTDLHALDELKRLCVLRLAMAPKLESLVGVEGLPVSELWIQGASRLRDISAIGSLAPDLRSLRFEKCRSIARLDDISALRQLTFLEFGDCGEIESLKPLAELRRIEHLYAWGNTRIVDNDLAPLGRLTHLGDLRMMDRTTYRPALADVKVALGFSLPTPSAH